MMKRVVLYLWLAVFGCLAGRLQAQGVGPQGSNPLPERFLWEVKQLDQFFGRFNGDEDLYGQGVKPAGANIEFRGASLTSLFNQDLLGDSLFRRRANEFVSAVLKGSGGHKISFYDEDWYSTVVCSVLYKSQPRVLTLTLVSEGDAQQGTKWVIAGAEADFLEGAGEVQGGGIIPPTNHELNFPDLVKAFNQDYSNIETYTSTGYRRSQLRSLTEAVSRGEIEMKQVQSTTYHFLQVPGWIFTVRFYNRNSRNSGWLISSLQKVSRAEQKYYKTQKLNIYH